MQQIPHGLRLNEFIAKYQQLLADGYEKQADGFYVCKACKMNVQEGTAYISIHDSVFPGCGGAGQVKKVPIPGCPHCEPDGHTMYTCVHIDPEEAEELASLILPLRIQ